MPVRKREREGERRGEGEGEGERIKEVSVFKCLEDINVYHGDIVVCRTLMVNVSVAYPDQGQGHQAMLGGERRPPQKGRLVVKL